MEKLVNSSICTYAVIRELLGYMCLLKHLSTKPEISMQSVALVIFVDFLHFLVEFHFVC